MITSPAVIRTTVFLLRVIPVWVLRPCMRAVGTLGYFAIRARRQIVLDNVARLAPNASRRTQRQLARRTFANLVDASVDLLTLSDGLGSAAWITPTPKTSPLAQALFTQR